MNLDNFTPGDAFLYDSWNRDDGHHHDQTGSTDVAKVLKKYEKAKTKQELQNDKKLMNLPEIFEILHSENDFSLHNDFELLKHRCKLYLEKVDEYKIIFTEGSFNTTSEERSNWQQDMKYIDAERTDLHDKLIGQYNKIAQYINNKYQKTFNLMDLKTDREMVRFWAEDIIKSIEKEESSQK